MTLQRLLASFGRKDDGAIAIIFGLSFMALMAAMGIAIDYARGLNMQTRLQSDLDAAVLGGGSQMRTADDVAAVAKAYFNDNWKQNHGVSDVTLEFTTLPDDKGIKGTATAKLPNVIMQVLGFEDMTLNAVSEVLTASQHVEVALVLDTTASMSGTKLDALKSASKLLIDTAYELETSKDYIKIGIVPFAMYVNVGLANRNQSWMSVPLDASTPKQSCGYQSPVTSKTNCRMVTYTAYNDGTPYTYQVEECDYTYGPEEYVCTDYVEEVKWYGCAGSRAYPLDTQDDTYSTPVPGVMNVSCGAEVTTLDNDKDALKAKIDGLIAVGETYVPGGIMWGWTLLSKTAPFADAYDYNETVDGNKVRKIMVVMTDGTNTLSPTYPEHWGTDTVQSNTLTSELCANVKAKDITIYSVAFEVTDVTTQDLLRNCASSPANFFNATGADELADAFKSIASNFTPLVLSQ